MATMHNQNHYKMDNESIPYALSEEKMNGNTSIRLGSLEPDAQASGSSAPRPPASTITTTMPAVDVPADASSRDKPPQTNKKRSTKGPVVKIKAVKRSEYVTTTVVRGVPAPCADTYYLFLRRQLKCTGYHHENGDIELFRVSCSAVRACLQRLWFSEKDLDFQVVNEAPA